MNKLSPVIATTVVAVLVPTLIACQEHQVPPSITIAATATSNEPAPSLNTEVRELMNAHAKNALFPADAIVNVISQGNASITIDITPMRGSEVEADPSKATEQIEKHLSSINGTFAAQAATTDGLDVLGTMAPAIDITPAGGTIVLQTSGLSTVPPLELNKSDSWIAEPTAFADKINDGDLPNAAGRHIHFVGLGYTAGEQSTPTIAANKALQSMWHRICERAQAASCSITPGPAGHATPQSTNKVETISFNTPATPCTDSIELDADLAFTPNASALTRAGKKQLRSISNELADCPTDKILNADGHTATVPGGGDGVDLSTKRAQNVLDHLRSLGAPESALGTAVGHGNTKPRVNNMPNGRYSELLARRNRVVVLTFAKK